MRRLGKAVGNVAVGYAQEKDADARRDAQRCMLAVMAENPDAGDKEVARIALTRLAKEHAKDDPRLSFVTPKEVARLRRVLALAALERAREKKE
jgi:hypothetical protein